MRRLTVLLSLALVVTFLAAPVQADFKRIVRGIEREGKVRRTWMPLLPLARIFIRFNPVEGISDFRLAVFGKNRLTAKELDTLVRRSVSDDWSPLVQVRDRTGSHAQIYARPAREGEMQVLIVAREPDETFVIQARVNPETFAAMVAEPRSAVHTAGR